MDEAFLLRARRLLNESRPAPLDHFAFVAKVVARQSSSPASIASRLVNDAAVAESPTETVTSLLLARDEWRSAARGLEGCFSRAGARRRVNEIETPMTGIFTLRF